MVRKRDKEKEGGRQRQKKREKELDSKVLTLTLSHRVVSVLIWISVYTDLLLSTGCHFQVVGLVHDNMWLRMYVQYV